MQTETRTTDPKARVILPKEFASTTVIVEQISETECRIRKARVIPEDEIRFEEEFVRPLSDKDRDLFLALLENPPELTEAMCKALERNPIRVG